MTLALLAALIWAFAPLAWVLRLDATGDPRAEDRRYLDKMAALAFSGPALVLMIGVLVMPI